MEFRIESLPAKKLVGMHLSMSLAENKTYELWRSFMPRRKEILNNVSSELLSMQLFDPSYDFKYSNVNAQFEKWAAVEVKDFENIPEGMESFELIDGLYAVFLYKGPASLGAQAFQYIFETWLPNSGYLLDNRPHFEVLGEKYKNNDPDSEEEIWIPIRSK